MKTPSTTPLMARRGDPRGQVLVLFALMLVVLLLVSALAVDYGGWLVTKRNYQNVSDAASLAGAQQLTRSITTSKQQLARQAAWQSVKSALNFPGLDPVAQSATSSSANGFYTANGYKVWVASPPSDAGSAYVGHVSGPGVVYVRIDHPGLDYLSRIVNINRNVTAWSTAGRFPANFAVIGMCSPTSVTTNCLAGDANIKLDGTTTNLIINTGDLGTNRWVKDGGSSSGVALGSDSNAYMQLFDTCWSNASNQCQLWGYNSPNIDTSTIRSAIPLGAPIPDPNYAAPTINSTTAPNECRGTGTVQLASVQVLERNQPDSQVSDLPIKLASVIQPAAPVIRDAASTANVSGLVKSQVGSTLLNGITVTTTPVTNTDTTGQGSNPNGGYKIKVNQSTTYTITATDPNGIYSPATTTVDVGTSDITAPVIFMQKYPTISGTIRSSAGGTISGASVSITGAGGPYPTTPATSGAGGAYGPVIITGWGPSNTWNVNASASFYTSNLTNSGFLALDGTYTVDVTLTPAPASVAGTVTDAVTGLGVPGVTVTLGNGGSGTSAGTYGTPTNGAYTISVATPGPQTITLTGSALTGYAYATPASGSTITVAAGPNPNTNITLWPKGCYDGGSSGSFGSWSCSWPSGSNCPATTNPDASDGSLTCAFTQANAIRPGTYNDITLPNNTCAWLDPRGGATGLATGQMAGIYHVKGTISLGSNSYLFGDGVTIVMDQGSNFDVNNGGGFVLNYGTIKVGGGLTCAHPSDFVTAKQFNDGLNPCFQTQTYDTQDYAYAAWTTNGSSPWQTNSGSGCVQASTPTYFTNDTNLLDTTTTCFKPGTDLGITFYMYGSGLGNNSRMKLATANMGYLFNGVLYAPKDDVQLGGGKDGQSAAGQIVGWTIEYHGGTRILQNWYGNPVDGQPFLIEPVLGE